MKIKKKNLIVYSLLFLSALILFGTQDVKAESVLTANITSPLNLTVNNQDNGLLAVTFTATTNFTGTTLNCSYYSQTVGTSYAITAADWVITGGSTNDTANGTSTTITPDTALTVGNVSSVMIGCTDEAAFQVNSSHLFYEVNDIPYISLVGSNGSHGGFPIARGKTLSFNATWTDNNASGNDANSIYICSTNSFTNGACDGTQFCTQSNATDGQSECTWTIPFTQPGGVRNAYAFILDDNAYANSTGQSVEFRVIGGSDDDDVVVGGNGGDDVNGDSGDVSVGATFSAKGIILIIILVAGIIMIWRTVKKKR